MNLPVDADARIVALVTYWQSRRPAPDLLPARHHLSPVDLGELRIGILRHIWLLDVEPAPLRFRLRLIGGALKAAGSPGTVGSYVDEHDAHGALTTALTAMCADRRPVFRRGAPTMPHEADVRLLENVLLPLAVDGTTVDMIVGCTVYLGPGVTAGDPIVLR